MPQFLLLIYNDHTLVDALPTSEYDGMMRQCLARADDLQRDGQVIETRMLAAPATAKTIRVRNGRTTAFDGPFAEAKEVLGGFYLIEGRDIDEAVQLAMGIPWARTGCIEIRPLEDVAAVRRRVGAPPAPETAAV